MALKLQSRMIDKLKAHILEVIDIQDDKFTTIASYFVPKKFKKGEYIISQGSRVPYIYYVVKGIMKLIFIDASGKEHVLSFAQEDWWESDYAAFYDGTFATMSLKCLDDCEVLCLSLSNLNELCATIPKMESFFLKKANNGHIASQQRILSLLSTNPKERYEQLAQKHPFLLERVSKTQLAAYLGVSRETLSRFSK